MKLKKSVLYKLNLLSLTKADFKNFTPKHNSRKLTIKYKSKELSIYEKDIIQSVVCKEFKLPKSSIQFVHFAEGSIYLIYRTSLKVMEHLLNYSISADMIKSLFDNKIVCIAIDDKVELKVSHYFNTGVSAVFISG